MPQFRRKVIGSSGWMSWQYPGVEDLVTVVWSTAHAASRDGRSVHCDLGLLGRPLDSCPLVTGADPEAASYFFDLEYRDFFAIGLLILETDPALAQTSLLGQFRYGRHCPGFRGRIWTWLNG